MEAFTPITYDSDDFSPFKVNFNRVFLPPETLDHSRDVTLVVEDGKEFKCHKGVLSEASPFFEKLLNSDMKESKEGVVRLDMVSESVMAATLEFIYTGNVQILTHDMAQDLIIMADYLFLPRLRTPAEEFVMQKLNDSSCISTYYFAERHQCKELVYKAKNFILANFTTVAKTKEFLDLSSKEVEMWISSDEIHVTAEEDVFKIILSWLEHDHQERKKYFANLFGQVRLAYVSRDVLCSDILTNNFVRTEKESFSLAMDAVKLPNSKNHRTSMPRVSQRSPVIVTCVNKYILCYFPCEDRWCLLGEIPDLILNSKECEVFSCHSKLYFLQLRNNCSVRLLCYETFSNCWTRQQYNDDGRYFRKIFVRNEDEIYALVSDGCHDCENLSCLCYTAKRYVFFLTRYKTESNKWEEISSFDFGLKEGICVVDKDSYIYFIGGGVREQHMYKNTSDVVTYDLNLNKWDKVADIQEGRMFACGAATKNRMFIAGGLDREGMTLNTCETYNEATNEWHFIANMITKPNFLSNMVCCDGKVYVLGGCYDNSSHQTVQCYDPDIDEWKKTTQLPVRIPLEPRGRFYLHACSMTIFSRSLSKLPITWLSRYGRREEKRKCVIM